MLSGPIGLFLVAHIVFPENIENSDLKEYYFSISQRIWGIASIVVVVGTLFRPIAFGDSLLDWSNLSSLVLLVIFVTLTISNNKKLNEVLVPFLLIAVVADILIFSQRI